MSECHEYQPVTPFYSTVQHRMSCTSTVLRAPAPYYMYQHRMACNGMYQHCMACTSTVWHVSAPGTSLQLCTTDCNTQRSHFMCTNTIAHLSSCLCFHLSLSGWLQPFYQGCSCWQDKLLCISVLAPDLLEHIHDASARWLWSCQVVQTR